MYYETERCDKRMQVKVNTCNTLEVDVDVDVEVVLRGGPLRGRPSLA